MAFSPVLPRSPNTISWPYRGSYSLDWPIVLFVTSQHLVGQPQATFFGMFVLLPQTYLLFLFMYLNFWYGLRSFLLYRQGGESLCQELVHVSLSCFFQDYIIMY